MPAAKASGDAAAGGPKREMPSLVAAAQFEKELLRQRQFGAVWGELIEGGCPKTLDEAIAQKRAQIAQLKAQSGGVDTRNAMYTTQQQRDFPHREGLGNLVSFSPRSTA
jgi:hypothetical protein